MTKPERYFLLDVSRGVAALAVVLAHFAHFYRYPSEQGAGLAGAHWLANWLWPFYEYSGYAVQYFFVLSGFIFYEFYHDQIRQGRVGGWKFFALRFSRLYPLHFVTLLIVAALQAWTVARFGASFIYDNNDPFHFVLQLGFASNWGLEAGPALNAPMKYSFNGPVWSVSLEVLAYIAFFFVAKFLPRGIIPTFLIALLSFVLARYGATWIGMVMACFFSGGLACEALRLVTRSGNQRRIVAWMSLAGLTVAAAYLAIFLVPGVDRIAGMIVWGVVFPSIVVILGAAQWLRPAAGRELRIVGDITYASYLTHFPIQLAMAPLFFVLLGGTAPDVGLLAVYVAVTLLVSVAVFRFFEMPAQTALRELLLGNRAKRAQPAASAG